MSSMTYVASTAIEKGDVVSLVGGGVQTARAPLLAAAPIVGIALASANAGQSVAVADCGGVPASVTGLGAGMTQPISVSSSGKCTRTLEGAAWLIGDANAAGDLEIRPRIFASLDVRLFGAVGDGVTDDGGSIQAAVAAYGSSSGCVAFTGGVFRIAGALSIPVNVTAEFGAGGQIYVNDGVLVVFDGPVVAYPLQQIFRNALAGLAGQGTVDLRGNRESYVEWWGARGLNLGFDDAPAFQAAINASRHHLGWNQTSRWGGTAVRFFNGPYRWASPVHLSGSVTLEREKPGEFSPSLIVVDPDVGDTTSQADGGALVVDGYAYDGDPLRLQAIPEGDWARIRNMSMKQLNDFHSLVITCGVKVYAPRVQIENFYAYGFGDGITITSTKDYSGIVPGALTYADSCELSGTIDLPSCSRYGLWIHGGDANVTNMKGALSVSECGSWGLVLDSFLGDGALAAIHTASNGIQQRRDQTTWGHGDADYGGFIWAAGRAAVLGDLVLPPPPHASGWQYRVTTVSPTAPTYAGPEPLWSDAVAEGATLTDANGNVFTAWMEEGGSAIRHSAGAANGMVVIGFLYQELDQQSARLEASVILGQTKDTEIDPRYAPRWGFSGYQLMPFVYQTSWLVPWGPPTNPYAVGHPVQVRMGGNFASPFVVRTFDASQLPPDRPQWNWHCENPNWLVSEEWYPDWKRWLIRAGAGYDHIGYSICGSRSLPYAGAICFPHLFVGGNPLFGTTGGEVRVSAVSPASTAPYLPDIVGSGIIANRGAWTQGDWIWNITRNPAQQPLHPVAASQADGLPDDGLGRPHPSTCGFRRSPGDDRRQCLPEARRGGDGSKPAPVDRHTGRVVSGRGDRLGLVGHVRRLHGVGARHNRESDDARKERRGKSDHRAHRRRSGTQADPVYGSTHGGRQGDGPTGRSRWLASALLQ